MKKLFMLATAACLVSGVCFAQEGDKKAKTKECKKEAKGKCCKKETKGAKKAAQ